MRLPIIKAKVAGMKNIEKSEVRSHNKVRKNVRALFAENTVKCVLHVPNIFIR